MAGRLVLLLPLGAALLFGSSTPLSKLLLGSPLDPLSLAAVLYLGSGFALAAWHSIVNRIGLRRQQQSSIRREDLPWLAAAVAAGGVAAPILLLYVAGPGHAREASAELDSRSGGLLGQGRGVSPRFIVKASASRADT